MKKYLIIISLCLSCCYHSLFLDKNQYKVNIIFDNILEDFFLIELKSNENYSSWVISKKSIHDSSEMLNHDFSQIIKGQIIQTSLVKFDTLIIFNSSNIRGGYFNPIDIEYDGKEIIKNDTLIVELYKSKDIVGNFIQTGCLVQR